MHIFLRTPESFALPQKCPIVSSLVAVVISVKERIHATFSKFEIVKSFLIISTFHHAWQSLNEVCFALYIALVWAVKGW